MRGKLRAIDLYAGIGGWSLGLQLAGVEVVRSYEWWAPAVETYNKNLGSNEEPIDIRRLELSRLPSRIDIVVGSPPCTEFSLANRGGNGDMLEGMKDLVQFFRIVEYLKPQYWIMENVPRVAHVIRQGLNSRGHPLFRFRKLNPSIELINFADFGLAQNRTRCVVGNFPFDRLNAYKPRMLYQTLGTVVSALKRRPVVKDPTWNISLDSSDVTELAIESHLDSEQLRMNHDAKVNHPVYNGMTFPDNLTEPSRTVTATCTRVSRESIIVADDSENGLYRRLTVRERATLQGFPITYQFYSKNYNEKIKFVGNAIPPTFSYLAASAMLQTAPSRLRPFSKLYRRFKIPSEASPVTKPNAGRQVLSSKRTFRAAIPNLRLKSGMRFEFANKHNRSKVSWSIHFFFGPSKKIQTVKLDRRLLTCLRRSAVFSKVYPEIFEILESVNPILGRTSPSHLQGSWSRTLDGVGPFELIDRLGLVVHDISRLLPANQKALEACLVRVCGVTSREREARSSKKLRLHASTILVGMVVGAWFNSHPWHRRG